MDIKFTLSEIIQAPLSLSFKEVLLFFFSGVTFPWKRRKKMERGEETGCKITDQVIVLVSAPGLSQPGAGLFTSLSLDDCFKQVTAPWLHCWDKNNLDSGQNNKNNKLTLAKELSLLKKYFLPTIFNSYFIPVTTASVVISRTWAACNLKIMWFKQYSYKSNAQIYFSWSLEKCRIL